MSSQTKMYKLYQDFLSSLENTAKLRKLPEPKLNQNVINFASNDYLQLSKHPQVIEAAKLALDQFGIGATGARLLTGNYPLIEEFEKQIAKDKNTEAALIFPSGFQTNSSVLATLTELKILGTKPLVFFDKLNHASLYQGLKVQEINPIRYRHLDLDHLNTLMSKYKHSSAPKFIVSETVFGMDGDQVNLSDLIQIAKAHNAFLYLDEAHATGMFGRGGYGLSTLEDLSPIPHLIMGSFSKAIGVQGGYIACSQILKHYLINKCPGFIYSTASSPALVGAAYAAWQLIPHLQASRERILGLSQKLHQALEFKGYAHPQASTHIQPLLLKNDAKALDYQAWFLENRIRCSAIRPPTVPTARLRFAIHAGIQENDINYLIEVIYQC
jgi:8-amino-7-oxononanoate synthase